MHNRHHGSDLNSLRGQCASQSTSHARLHRSREDAKCECVEKEIVVHVLGLPETNKFAARSTKIGDVFNNMECMNRKSLREVS